jgi:pimeloyl-CoA dehydrogenase small subunit
MDFDLTDEQRLLKESVDRLITDRYSFEQRKKYLTEPNGWSLGLWSQYAELGLLGLPFPEALGGFSGGPVEIMIVMEAFGRGLIQEPYFATVILGGGLIRHLGSQAQQAELIPQIAQGSRKLAFAHIEHRSRWNLADVTTTARRDGSSWVLNGTKSVVLHGDVADSILVTARTAGPHTDREGIGLFLLDPNTPGMSRRSYPTQHGLRAAEITLDNARTETVLGEPEHALPAIEHAVDEAVVALCAEAVGIMTCMHEITLGYLKARHQFGRPIGQFQALQHRAVDMLTALEQARSMTLFATMMAQKPDATERRRAICAAKAQVGRSGRHVGQEAIQLHGGIGITMEYKASHYFKRMTIIDQMFGDADQHLAELAQLGGLFDQTA